MNTCPKCGSPQVEEQTNYAKETGRTWWVCGTFQTRDCHPHHSELCLEREEKNTLQAKLDDLQASTKRETLYAVNDASCKTVAYFAVDENGKDPIEPIPKDKPDWAFKEGYWHEQYQLMRERYHKQIGENSKQAERIRELEEQLQAREKETMKTSSSEYNTKCIVHECNNRMWEGEFVGQLCKPCYLMLTTGEIVPSTSFVARLFRERDEALKKLEQERDRSATCRVISIGNELEANYYKIQVEQLLQENIKLNIKLKTNE